MNILIFIIILGVLVFIHELGHFLFAKAFKVRVDEFGFGYPPKMFRIGHWRGTDITMNWIPFGGFVRLFGESDSGKEISGSEKKVSLVYKPRWQQFLVMFGGILFNIILAWVLLSSTYMFGIRSSVSTAPENYTFTNSELMVTQVLDASPAADGGLLAGDVILEYGSGQNDRIQVENQGLPEFSDFVHTTGQEGNPLSVLVKRDDQSLELELYPSEGLVPDRYGVGIGLDRVGTLRLPFFEALWYGAQKTLMLIGAIVVGLWQLLTGGLSLNAVSGPVGIVSAVGQASSIGWVYLVSFTALLSLNLAVLNALPFPALDGGRIVIIFIESLIGRRLPANAVNWVNGVGFIILLGLMVLVTANDIIRLL